MRYLILISLIILGCKKESNTTTNSAQQTVVKDCNCDRVVFVNEFNLNDGTKFGGYSTINDCSGVQRDKDWKGSKPVMGQCR
jgi:hypothetical protein